MAIEDLKRDSGQLITSQSWNDLIDLVIQLRDDVDTRLVPLETQVGTLTENQEKLLTQGENHEERLVKLETQFGEISEEVSVLTGQYLRLTMETERQHYPVGNQATVTARLSDLRGNPLTFSQGDTRPWIDFTLTWGLVRAAPGFQSRGGAGERAVSVRVDESGVARILVRAEHGEDVAEEQEQEVASALSTRFLPSRGTPDPNGNEASQTIIETVLQAATPMEAHERGAFRLLRAEYDRPDAGSVRGYIDAGYLKYKPNTRDRTVFRPVHRWRDYRATVTAFVKADGDPTTADHAMGVSSLQLIFRDWIGPFVHLEYLENIETPTAEFENIYRAAMGDQFDISLENAKNQTRGFVRDKGWLGRQRGLKAAKRAIDRFVPPQETTFAPVLKDAMRDALVMQATLDNIDFAEGEDRDRVLDVFTNANLRADVEANRVTGAFESIRQEFTAVQTGFEQVQELEREVLQFDVREDLVELRTRFDRTNEEIKNLNDTVIKLDVRSDLGDLRGKQEATDSRVGQLGLSLAAMDQRTIASERRNTEVSDKQAVMEDQIESLRNVNVDQMGQQVGQIPAIVNRLRLLENAGPR